jgi:RHS repeat-associated protein
MLIGSLSVFATGQNIQFTQGNVGTGLDHQITVPLRSYPGRGAADLPVNLTYSSRVWRIGPITTILNNQWAKYQTITEAIYAENSVAGWKSSLDLPIIEWPRNDDTYYYSGKPFCHVCGSNARQFRVARVYITMPDGSKHELRKGDQPYEGSIDMVGTFYAVDSSRLRYDSTSQTTGTLYLSDGTRYVLNGGSAQYIDRNGNTLNYNATTRQWTDTLNRVIGQPLPANPTAGEQLYYLPGMPLPYKLIWKHLSDTGVLTPLAGGGTPTRKPIANDYLPFPNNPPTPPSGNNFPQKVVTSWTEQPSLFISTLVDDEDMGPETIVVGRGQVGGELFDPIVLAEIVMPNNLSYKFTYNIYGEVDKVVYPTGAFEKYQLNKIPTIGDVKPPYSQASRGTTSRQLSANGTGNDVVEWLYAVTGVNGFLKYTTTPPLNGAVTEAYRKVFPTPSHQVAQGATIYYWPFGFEDARQGEVYEMRTYAAGAQGAMLRRTIRDFDQTSNTVQPSIPQLDPTTKTAYRNRRLIKVVNLMLDTGADALVKTLTCEFASNGFELTTGLEQTASNETYFATVDQTTAQTGLITDMPAGAVANRVETTYLNNTGYLNRNILGLASAIVMKNANLQVVSKTESFFDEVAYPLEPYGDLTGADYVDPGTSLRGNATTVRRYFDIAAGLYLETHAQFDQCGNNVSIWNARGIQSQTQFSSTFKHAYATGTISAVPDPSGAHGSTTVFTTSIDYESSTGLPLSATDGNGQTTTFSYQDDFGVVDPMKRLRKTTRPDGGWTKNDFNDVPGDLFTYTQIKQDDTKILKTYQYVDPLGRSSRTFMSEGGSNYLATDILYDGLGRVLKNSNPYRTAQRDGVALESHTANWTTTHYDAMGRVDLITYPDASTVQTLYEGIYTTVTDQAGKKLRQQTDALGRITRVDEPDANGNLGSVTAPVQATYYEYGTGGNIVHVSQNGQHRYFRYDALGRLTHERQAEPLATPFTTNDAQTAVNPTTNTVWTRKLIYDETLFSVSYKGLLTSMYDARQVLTQSLYDNLNRPITITYSDGVTPTVNNYYDVQAFTVSGDNRTVLNKGRLAEVRTAATGSVPATSQFSNFDLMGRVIQSRQTVDTNNYTLGYFYNVGGALTSELYPSGRVVTFDYDNAARVNQVASGATIYANSFVYGTDGTLNSLTLGNGALQSFAYNSRLQIQSIDFTKAGTQIQHYDYKYGVFDPNTNTVDETKNNGQRAQVEGFIGTAKQWQQRFTYDSIGRLSTAREKRGDNSVQSYLVKYDYDIYGNRYQYQAQNGGNPFPQAWVEAGQISTTNNRFTSGITYDDAGNILTDTRFSNRQFLYDANNRQRQSANLDGSGAVISVFDGAGQRVATSVNGTITNINVYDASGTLVAEYGQSTTNGTQYVTNDHQGSPRVITSAAGTVMARHDYLPFGEELAAGVGMRTSGQAYGGLDGVQKKYAGMEKDGATGLSHTLWRKYDQTSGRWTSTDPYGGSMSVQDPQSFNRYTYVDNDPVNQTDPSGLMTGPEYGWSAVQDGFWGGSIIPFNRPHFGGPEAIAAAMASFDSRLQNTLDALAATEAFKNGDYALGNSIMQANSTLKKEGEADPHGGGPDPHSDQKGEGDQGPVGVTADVGYYAQIPASGTGFYRSGRPQVSYGNLEVLASLIEFASDWNDAHPDDPIGFGEMSNKYGQTVAPHVSHKLGLRIDIRLFRNDHARDGVSYTDTANYNQALTIELIRGLRALPHVNNILFNDPVTRAANLTIYHEGHDNHLHVNFTANW